MQNQTSNLQKGSSLTTGNSNADSFAISISKKSERLATALYLVTSFLSDSEPLKFRLRSLSIELVQKTGSVRYGGTMSDRALFEDTQRSITETLYLLELAFITDIISEMNFTVLKREYATLRDSIEVKKVSRESRTDSVLGDTFFGSTFHEPAPKGSPLNLQKGEPLDFSHIKPTTYNLQPTNSIGHSKGQTNIKLSDTNIESKGQGHHLNLQKGVPLELASFSTRTASIQKDARTTRILKLIKDNREVSIKDIANHFPELSEKTIQRELVSLTETKVLKKSGERRWSRYTLA